MLETESVHSFSCLPLFRFPVVTNLKLFLNSHFGKFHPFLFILQAFEAKKRDQCPKLHIEGLLFIKTKEKVFDTKNM